MAGSMILAGVLLKLGGYGLLLSSLFSLNVNIIQSVGVWPLLGGGLLAILILRISDIKVMIAYSSVVHIRIVRILCLSGLEVGLIGAALIIISHGFTSSGIFSCANIIYERSHSRGLSINKGVLGINPRLSSI